MKNVSLKLFLFVTLLFVVLREDLAKAKRCDVNSDCQGLQSCQRGPELGYCDDGTCKCLPLPATNTKTIDVNHGGICDTYLECGSMLCSDYRKACCINDKCACRKPGQNVPNCPN
ncbi:PREDICTED: defensin-like protein 285 [Camelina sativa]|uniref:Defensin-like protein 285 n=1 Tax=Camelina sativa TaxID=90675 RepID=A0ABM0YEC4_CAMSA|nr:PREDICTED: defensin-like protein 285 [Camelina sativa]